LYGEETGEAELLLGGRRLVDDQERVGAKQSEDVPDQRL
jgi:hypothetical protein